MSQVNRLSSGGRIDRDTSLEFTFNGRRMVGHVGDTVASALLANGVRIVGRSFKYHRPRGIVAAGSEEPNALLQLGTGGRTLPNQQATRVELFDGLVADSVNCWPGPDFDLMSGIGLFHRLTPAGFYYKTFMWPASFWKYYEHVIRRAAGLGRAPTEPDPDHYDRMNTHCDVLVVGAGPAGLSAALAAARAGARVILVDDQAEHGGSLLSTRRDINSGQALDWVAAASEEIAASNAVTVLRRTTAFGYYDHNFVGLFEQRSQILSDGGDVSRQRIWRVRAKHVITATGSFERPLIFADNDRPGVMLAGGVRAYVNRYGVTPGRKICVFTNNDDAYRTALDLHDAGVAVPAIIDVRDDPIGELPTEAMERGIDIIDASAVTGVNGARGVKSIEVMQLNAAGDGVTGQARTIECDVVCSSGGWNPAIHLHSHSGGKAVFDTERGIFVPGAAVQPSHSAGAAAGIFDLAGCLRDGTSTGKAAAANAGFKNASRRKVPDTDTEDEGPMRLLWSVPTTAPIGRRGKHFLDQAHDVTAADVQMAAREGYTSIEHAKRYTTLGMAPDQGKTGNIPGMAILGQALGVDNVGDVGTTTFRPPFTPVTLGALAGRDIGPLMDPVRMTPIHHWHELAGCKWEDVGQWKRPWYYPKSGETMQGAVNRECLVVRNAVGIMDASTLGKIDIQGPDAAEFLNRIYTNAWLKLKPGSCRYGLMLGEDGMIMDDGVTTRLADDHFLMTTTTGNAASVLEWLEEWLQTEWPELKVFCTSVSEHWANVTICGPRARNLLAEFTDDIALDSKSFPFMSYREGTVGGVSARVYRISFTGELSYEINVPASYALNIWTALMNAGEKYGITPYGTETMHVLRAEKGYIIAGQETDGTTTPDDLGMDWIVSKNKDFIGRRSLSRDDNMRNDRKQLVGLLPTDPDKVIPEGNQITETRLEIPPRGTRIAMIGHVTSSYYSANLGRSFALALIKDGRGRMGDQVYMPTPNGIIAAEITGPIFIDPDGERQDG
ncbi:MAG: sarcosine oxidase subunit alpha family protein [Rhodospirillaceae bacterium]|nr:sarcosine oxidase subunit alpha family protein [Rhodospirillaceae bacterium]